MIVKTLRLILTGVALVVALPIVAFMAIGALAEELLDERRVNDV